MVPRGAGRNALHAAQRVIRRRDGDQRGRSRRHPFVFFDARRQRTLNARNAFPFSHPSYNRSHLLHLPPQRPLVLFFRPLSLLPLHPFPLSPFIHSQFFLPLLPFPILTSSFSL